MENRLNTATLPDDDSGVPECTPSREILGLAIVWSAQERDRVGEVTLIDEGGQPRVLGRGAPLANDSRPRAAFVRQRPDGVRLCGALNSPKISRDQLLLQTEGTDLLRVRNVGRCALLRDGQAVESLCIRPGETLQLGSQLLLLCVKRPLALASSRAPYPDFAFGEPDAHDIVGESPAMWAVRQQLAFVSVRGGHAIVQGETGTGKELAARAIHALSGHLRSALVARNAATIPETLVDAELFGNVRDYPNRGMPERPGLIGQADGSTLFLDEIGELPAGLQAHLLRVLDSGEYQRLGESRARVSDFRLLAATNRSVSALKDDLLARFPFRIELPALNERREDIPLLVRDLLRRMASQDPELERAFVAGGPPRISLQFCRQLVEHPYTANVREVTALLWQSVKEGAGMQLEAPRPAERASQPSLAGFETCFGSSGQPFRSNDFTHDGGESDALSARQVQAALDRHNGILEDTWRALGLKNRFALMRLIGKYGLEVRRRSGQRRRVRVGRPLDP